MKKLSETVHTQLRSSFPSMPLPGLLLPFHTDR